MNCEDLHIQACCELPTLELPIDLEAEVPPKLPWLPMDIIEEFRKCHRLFEEDDPAMADLANSVVRNALIRCPMPSVSFWPSRAVSAYVETLKPWTMSEGSTSVTVSAAASPSPVPDELSRYLTEHSLSFEAPSFKPPSFQVPSSEETLTSNTRSRPSSVMTDMSAALFNLGSLKRC